MKDLVELGICTRPHGVKGGFSFTLANQQESILEVGTEIMIFPLNSTSVISPEGAVYVIEEISFGNKVIVYLQGITQREQVEEMLPFAIKIARASLPQLEDGEFYLQDLLGLTVYEHQSGKQLGEVIDFYENGAQTVLVLKIGGKKEDILFIDRFVPVVDLINRRIEINSPRFIDG